MSRKNYKDNHNIPVALPPGGIDLLGKPTGFIIGSRAHALMRFETDKHMVTIANTGGGKGRSVIIPNLLTHKGSVVSVEIGGASFNVSVNHRRNVLQQDIHVIDPLRATNEKTACFNVLDTVKQESPTFVSDMSTIAASILKDADGDQPSDPYWKSAPRALLLSLLIHVKTSPSIADQDRHLPRVAEIIASYPSAEWHAVMEEMAMDTGKFRAQLNKTGNYFRGKESQNTDSLVSSVSASLGFAEDPAIRDMLKTSSFNLADIRRNNTTIYIIMPDIEQYKTNAALLRLLIERAFAACPNTGDAGKNFTHQDRVVFLLDEFTQLGKLDIVDTGMQTARQKGITLWTVFQDIGRLEKLYGKEIAGSFLGAAGCVQIFDIGDERTKEYVSQRAGKQIAYIPSVQHGVNWSESHQDSWSETISHGTSHSKAEGTTLSDTESWNETIATGQSNANGNSSTSGWSDTSTSWPSSILPYPGEKISWLDKMRISSEGGPNKQFGRQNSITNSRTVTDTYNKSTAKGGSKGQSRQSGTTTGTSTQNARQNGGGTGHQTGGQYTISYQPQILPRLDPADVESYLGSDNQQIVFLRDGKRVQQFIDFRANWDQIPQLYSRALGPDHITMPYPEVLSPLLPVDPLPPAAAEILHDTTPEHVSWPAPPQWQQVVPACAARLQFSKEIQPAWWLRLTPTAIQEHYRSTKAQKHIMDLVVAQKNEDSQFSTACQNLAAQLAPYAEAVVQGEAHLSRRTIKLQRRAAALQREYVALFHFSHRLNEFQFVLNEDRMAEQALCNQTDAYKQNMNILLDVKKGWHDMNLPARPKALPKAKGERLPDESLNEALTSQILKPQQYINASPAKFTAVNDDCDRPAIHKFDVDGTLRNVSCKIHDKRANMNFAVAFGQINMEGSFLIALLGRVRSLFVTRIPERVYESARRKLWINAEEQLDNALHRHDQNKASWARTYNALPQKWEERCTRNRKDEEALDWFENHMNDAAQKMRQDRAALEERYKNLCAANDTLDQKRRDIFNNLASWPRWNEATGTSAPTLPAAEPRKVGDNGSENLLPTTTKPKARKSRKSSIGEPANIDYILPQPSIKPEPQ